MSSLKNRKPFKFKIVLLGEGAVGKSSLVLRYCAGKFSHKHLSTIQACYQKKTIEVDDSEVELNIWDTAGQEKYHALGPIYYRGSNGVLLIYDITDSRSFDKIKMWTKEVKTSLGNSAVLMIIGNKTDLENNRHITREEAESFASEENALYKETSAMDNIGIDEAFLEISEKMIEYQENNPEMAKSMLSNRPIQLIDDEDSEDLNENGRKSRKCCGG